MSIRTEKYGVLSEDGDNAYEVQIADYHRAKRSAQRKTTAIKITKGPASLTKSTTGEMLLEEFLKPLG